MIIRMWKGSTKRTDSDAYFDYLKETGLKEYEETPGNLGVYVLRRDYDDKTEFLLLSHWESMEAIKAFAGPTLDKAVFYPDDDNFLVEFDKHVTHYQVLHSPS